MPLVLDATAQSPEKLRELLKDFGEGLAGTLRLVRSPPGRVLHPLSLKTAEDLLVETIALSEAVADDAASPARLASVVNLQYAVLLAAIDLVKTHTDVPKVPGGKA